ncbi:hypothetical protein FVB43_18840 [Erwinia rhapontici]|uniref:hypothetical protein n=1 Tax=Erwinia rhapontici TaxID=55212 RepID=UPI00143867EB|nr:hypothetical protein [Erwinia rhapontici]NKG32087.1 hypothetical protein [Erwinia rhapontici]
MAFNTKKIDFAKMIVGMKNPNVFSSQGSVYLIDGPRFSTHAPEVEIYRASTMQEPGLISSANQAAKFRKWMEA